MHLGALRGPLYVCVCVCLCDRDNSRDGVPTKDGLNPWGLGSGWGLTAQTGQMNGKGSRTKPRQSFLVYLLAPGNGLVQFFCSLWLSLLFLSLVFFFASLVHKTTHIAHCTPTSIIHMGVSVCKCGALCGLFMPSAWFPLFKCFSALGCRLQLLFLCLSLFRLFPTVFLLRHWENWGLTYILIYKMHRKIKIIIAYLIINKQFLF